MCDFFFQVLEICNQNKVSKGKVPVGGKTPQYVEICDQVKNLMDQGETISPQLLSKLIKFKLLMIKNKDLDRREEDKKVVIDELLINVFYVLKL